MKIRCLALYSSLLNRSLPPLISRTTGEIIFKELAMVTSAYNPGSNKTFTGES